MQILYVATVEAGKLLKMAFNAAKETGKRVFEVILDPAAHAARAAPADLCMAVAAIAGATGITMVSAPAVIALPTLGAVGFSASGPIAGAFAEETFQKKRIVLIGIV